MLEQELADTNESLSEQTCVNQVGCSVVVIILKQLLMMTMQAIVGAKSKLEQEMSSLSHDFDEIRSEAALSEEKAQRSMIDAARLADKLRAEQDIAMILERDNKLLEVQVSQTVWYLIDSKLSLLYYLKVKDAQNRLDEAEQNALKGGKKAMAKMDTRIRELESELDAESRRLADAQKNLQKSERGIKELTYVQDEDMKNHERMQALVGKDEGKICLYRTHGNNLSLTFIYNDYYLFQ